MWMKSSMLKPWNYDSNNRLIKNSNTVIQRNSATDILVFVWFWPTKLDWLGANTNDPIHLKKNGTRVYKASERAY
jgi:hypothetical protein